MASSLPSTREDAPAVLYPSPHQLPRGQPFVSLNTLGKNVLTIAVNNKCRVRDVLRVGLNECRIAQEKLFGLALRVPAEGLGCDAPRHEFLFLDPDQFLHKYMGKSSRVPFLGAKTGNVKRLALYLRVVAYVDDIQIITCSLTLENYYIQLRENVHDQWAAKGSVTAEKCFEMAVLALRADKGDNPGGYFRAEHYFPSWVIEQVGIDYIRSHVPTAVADLHPMSRMDAMQQFCQEATRPPFALNTHVYGMRRHKLDTVDRALFTAAPSGITVSAVGEGGESVVLKRLQWHKISRLSFDRRCISLGAADGTRMQLYAHSEEKAKHILIMCRTFHQTLLRFSCYRLPRIREEEKCVDDAMSASTSGVASDYDKRDLSEELDGDEDVVEEVHLEENGEGSLNDSGTGGGSIGSSSHMESETQTDIHTVLSTAPSCPHHSIPSTSSSPPSDSSTLVLSQRSPAPSLPPPTLLPPTVLFPPCTVHHTTVPSALSPPLPPSPPHLVHPHYIMMTGPGPSNSWILPPPPPAELDRHGEGTSDGGPSTVSTVSPVASRSGSLTDAPYSIEDYNDYITQHVTSLSLRDLALSDAPGTSSSFSSTSILPPSQTSIRLSSNSESRIDSLEGVTHAQLRLPYPTTSAGAVSNLYQTSPLMSHRATPSISRAQSMPAHNHALIQPYVSPVSSIGARRDPPPYNAANALILRPQGIAAEGGMDGPAAFPQPTTTPTSTTVIIGSAPGQTTLGGANGCVPLQQAAPTVPSVSLEDLTRKYPMINALYSEVPSLFTPPREVRYEPQTALSLVPSSQLPRPQLIRNSSAELGTSWQAESQSFRHLPQPPPYRNPPRIVS